MDPNVPPHLDDTPQPRLRSVASGDGLSDGSEWARYLAAFDDHGDHLLRIALLMLRGDHHDAEDAVAEVFLAAHRPWREGRIDDLGGYLRRSLTNRITSRGRHRVIVDRFRRSHRIEDDDRRALADTAADHVTLARALDTLPARQRAVVVLRYYEGLSVAETAAELGVAEGTVKSQASDALARLRTELEGED